MGLNGKTAVFDSFLQFHNEVITPFSGNWGWSGGAMALGKLPVPGRPTIWITVGQGPTALAIGVGELYGHCSTVFFNFHTEVISPFSGNWGRSGGAMALGKLPVPGRPTIWIKVGQGPTALAVGVGCLDIFTLIYPFFPLPPSLWETVR